jgi:hypothetical protein
VLLVVLAARREARLLHDREHLRDVIQIVHLGRARHFAVIRVHLGAS